jgi:hypothetical protein
MVSEQLVPVKTPSFPGSETPDVRLLQYLAFTDSGIVYFVEGAQVPSMHADEPEGFKRVGRGRGSTVFEHCLPKSVILSRIHQRYDTSPVETSSPKLSQNPQVSFSHRRLWSANPGIAAAPTQTPSSLTQAADSGHKAITFTQVLSPAAHHRLKD